MITQDNEILDYETCKLLKKVGFDEPCEQLYSTAIRHKGLDDEIEYIEGGQIDKMYNRNSFDIINQCDCVSAPDIYTVMRWLRKDNDINIEIGYNGDIYKWCWSSTYCSDGHPYPYDGLADSYESAAKDAILFFVKNVLYHRYYNKTI